MYPGDLDMQTVVYVPKMGDMYCGKDRPEHFYGVTTVVSRLFNMVQPDVAVFGKKDYQQVAIIRRMVEDLAYPIQVVGVDTVRAKSGLALSSRNGYLNDKQLDNASQLQQTLQWIVEQLNEKSEVQSKKAVKQIEDEAKQQLKKNGFNPQYVNVCRQFDLLPAKKGDTKLVVLAAAQIGKSRLIDNLEVVLR